MKPPRTRSAAKAGAATSRLIARSFRISRMMLRSGCGRNARHAAEIVAAEDEEALAVPEEPDFRVIEAQAPRRFRRHLQELEIDALFFGEEVVVRAPLHRGVAREPLD